MSRDKQIEEMVIALTESQHEFDKAWHECLHNNGKQPERENVFYAKYLVENAGYRKSSDVAREIFEEIDTLIVRRMIPEIAWIDDRFITDITELKKKYTEGER